MSSHTPTPYIIDTGVLIEIARGDLGLITLMQTYDSRDQPLVVPTLALVGASLDVRSDEADDLLAGLDLLDAVTIAPLSGPEQAASLADVIARTGLGPWDAHVAAVADASVCPILTLDRGPWEGVSRALDEPLHFMVIADPDE
ncbi:PIN domain-containing protein [Nonomuraea zeae]|uniref:PIN domain-containing protein n=1 Tax=Nonomuraea zeae TaxID=1642303 RepID=UPI0014791476|nr:PIN domain-containing protein [Nonomuraea zeae]